MSKRANPTLVGSFIVAGVILALAGVIAFGALRWFSPMSTFVIYFEDTAEGLDEGSVVKFRGVTIGQVKAVLIHFNQTQDDFHLPILIEIDERLLRSKMDTDTLLTDPAHLRRAITNGLRARLELESLITGRLYVSLIIDPQAAPPRFHQVRAVYEEIPSQLTEMARLKRSLTQINLPDLAAKVDALLDRLNQTLDNLHAERVSETAISTMNSLQQLAGSHEITNTLVAIQRAANQFRRVAEKIEPQLDPLAADARQTLENAADMMTDARHAIQELRALLGPRSTLRVELETALANLADAADAVGAFAELIRRNPQALLRGRERATPSR
ncbi:MAG: MCE family protein [Verrucomicrobia bacterium]|nr:MCE family protein [Verrucomicrobiota bacterium]